MIRLRLLPDDRSLGLTPYLWLGYLPILFAAPVLEHAAPGKWAVTIVAGVVFLALYFRGYWTTGAELLAIAGAMALLGFALMPTNFGASVFVTYAAAFLGMIKPRRRAVLLLVALCACVVVVGIVTKLRIELWMFELLLVVTMGATNVHFMRVREMNRDLRMAREEVEQLARVAERERIARDLHDVLGHTLTLITLKSALAARLTERDPALAAVEMRDVERASREALQEVRAAVAGQREVGLAGELESARAMLTAAGIAVEHDASPVALSSSEEATLALAMREAVTNVVRHAGASLCRITLTSDGAARSLAIEDDGHGKRGRDGNGLTGMRDRVRALGGHVVVDAGTLSGTRVQITLAKGAS
jgi:two-component system, NarL family, sensor histidine kinase DesK